MDPDMYEEHSDIDDDGKAMPKPKVVVQMVASKQLAIKTPKNGVSKTTATAVLPQPAAKPASAPRAASSAAGAEGGADGFGSAFLKSGGLKSGRDMPVVVIPEKVGGYTRYMGAVDSGVHFDSPARPCREMLANWFDAVRAAMPAGMNELPKLETVKTQEMAYYRFHYAGKTAGELWFKLQTNDHAKTVEDNLPFMLFVNHGNPITAAQIYTHGASTKTGGPKQPGDKPTEFAGKFGEGIKAAMGDAMRRKWDLVYIFEQNFVYFGKGVNPRTKDLEYMCKCVVNSPTLHPGCKSPSWRNFKGQQGFDGTIVKLWPLQHDPQFCNSFEELEMTFLPLMDMKIGEKHTMYIPEENLMYGIMFDKARFKGRIYVKGHYVRTDPALSIGFQTNDADLYNSRTREMDDEHLERAIWRTWVDAAMTKEAYAKQLYQLLKSKTPRPARDIKTLVTPVPANLANKIAALHRTEYGEGEILMYRNNMDQDPATEFNVQYLLGKKPLFTSCTKLMEVLSRSEMINEDLNTLAAAMERLETAKIAKKRMFEGNSELFSAAVIICQSFNAARREENKQLCLLLRTLPPAATATAAKITQPGESSTTAAVAPPEGPSSSSPLAGVKYTNGPGGICSIQVYVNIDNIYGPGQSPLANLTPAKQMTMVHSIARLVFEACGGNSNNSFIHADKFFAHFYEQMFPLLHPLLNPLLQKAEPKAVQLPDLQKAANPQQQAGVQEKPPSKKRDIHTAMQDMDAATAAMVKLAKYTILA